MKLGRALKIVRERKHVTAVALQLVLLTFWVGSISAAAAEVPVPFAPGKSQPDDQHGVAPTAGFVLVKKHRIDGASSEVVSPPSVDACDEKSIAETVRSNRSKYMPMDDYKKIIKLFQIYKHCHVAFEVDVPLAFGGYIPKIVQVDLAVSDRHLIGCVSVKSKSARPDLRYSICFYKDSVTIEQD
jgi:hypothetical protein